MQTKILLDKTNRNVVQMASAKYDQLHDFILAELQSNEEISFDHLLLGVEQSKIIEGGGNLAWCLLQVKRDLEARGIIQVMFEDVPSRVQKIKLTRKKRSSF